MKQPTNKTDFVIIPQSGNSQWRRLKNRSYYINDDGTTVVLTSHPCKRCSKKFEIRNPNLQFIKKTFDVSSNMSGRKTDLFICQKANQLIAGATVIKNALPSMQLCPDCGVIVSITSSCNCGNTMADIHGYVKINIDDIKISGNGFTVVLTMQGYPHHLLRFTKNDIHPGSIADPEAINAVCPTMIKVKHSALVAQINKERSCFPPC